MYWWSGGGGGPMKHQHTCSGEVGGDKRLRWRGDYGSGEMAVEVGCHCAREVV